MIHLVQHQKVHSCIHRIRYSSGHCCDVAVFLYRKVTGLNSTWDTWLTLNVAFV